MDKRVEFHDGARLDFDQSFDWYANRSANAPIGFSLAVDEAITSILTDPQRFPRTLADCRYCALHRYPFRIVFQDLPDRLLIIAVAHAKRRPGYWRDRI